MSPSTTGQQFSEISYATIAVEGGSIATITLDRPEAANALGSVMIDELDAALDLAEADAEVRVVVIAGSGKHFCAGHDLKELFAGESDWAALRTTAEGKWHHEQVMYFDRCVRIRDFRLPTIAAVHGVCSAAGLMLAAMCDLIVATTDARFSNPVLRMSGAGVELLVEPWELGPRRAKEFLLCATTLTGSDARQIGLVNRTVEPGDDPAAAVGAAATAMAAEVALVPTVTAQAVKASINHMIDGMGQRDSWRHHFMIHQFVSNTATALGLMAERTEGGMDHVKREQRGG